MHCPFCKHEDTRVVDSRVADEGQAIRRRRSCSNCGRRFTTVESAVLAVVDGPDGLEVILPADRHTTAPGAYSLTYGQGEHVARIGAIRSHDPRDGTVQRVVEEVYSGDLRSAVRGRLTGFVYPTPADAGLDATDGDTWP